MRPYVYVLQNLQQNLLGLPAIQSLQLLTRVDTVSTSIPDQFPRVFRGLGTFPESYEIKLTPEAPPFALFTPRTVPIPLRKKVAEELARMESLGVISRVDQPMSWRAGMVVVPRNREPFVSVWTSRGSTKVFYVRPTPCLK